MNNEQQQQQPPTEHQPPPLIATAIHQSNALAQYMQRASQNALLSNMGHQELEDFMMHYGAKHGSLCAAIFTGSMLQYQAQQTTEIITLLREQKELLKELIAFFQLPTLEEAVADYPTIPTIGDGV